MLKLNLGCGTYHLDGFHNLDILPERCQFKPWDYKDGIPYDDRSVSAITASHFISQVYPDDLPFICREMHRVLEPTGVVRITDEDNENEKSRLFGNPYPDSNCLIGPARMRAYLEHAGFDVYPMTVSTTLWNDDSLQQSRHGLPPDVFFMEAIKRDG